MKPDYFLKTEKARILFPALWCLLSLVVGVLFFDIGGAIFVSAMSYGLCLLLNKITQFVLSFQSHSGVVSNSFYENILKFIWFSSFIGILVTIVGSFIGKPLQEAYFNSVFCIVYFGFALAAATKWDSKYDFKDS